MDISVTLPGKISETLARVAGANGLCALVGRARALCSPSLARGPHQLQLTTHLSLNTARCRFTPVSPHKHLHISSLPTASPRPFAATVLSSLLLFLFNSPLLSLRYFVALPATSKNSTVKQAHFIPLVCFRRASSNP